MAHEYGHAFHHHALGGLADSGDGCGEHYLYSDENPGCAWNEGFADYFSVATMPEEGDEYNYINGRGPMADARLTGVYDGERVEGAVAAFMLHVSGAYNHAPVQPAANGPYVGLLVKTCKGQIISFTWLHVWSVEPVVMCMEQQVDPWVHQNYFRTDFNPTGQQSSAVPPSGWTASAVRATWLRDLYGV
jgi:hypothetical protein